MTDAKNEAACGASHSDAGLCVGRPPTPIGWSDTDWIKHLQERGEWPHPLAGLHINQGSTDAAADAYEAEYNAAHNAPLERIAGRSGGRLMHLEDQTEVVCFRPHDLAHFAEMVAADERERLAKVFDRQDVTFYGSAIATALRRSNDRIQAAP